MARTLSTPKLLVVSDRETQTTSLERLLTSEGALVDVERQIPPSDTGWDMALLLMATPREERATLQELKTLKPAPTIVLTTGDAIDRTMALELGASDCLSCPWDDRELAARVALQLRRGRERFDDSPTVGDLTIYRTSKLACQNGKPLALTAMEFRMLHVLLSQLGRVVTRETLSRELLGRPFEPMDRSLDMHVSRLRQKLGPHPDGNERIATVRGEGYVYTAPLPAGATDSSAGQQPDEQR